MADAAAVDQGVPGEAQSDDIRPIVARRTPGNLGLWLFFGALVIGGAWLFSVMSANRADIERSTITANLPEAGARISSPPPLALPAEFLGPDPYDPRDLVMARQLAAAPAREAAPPQIIEHVIAAPRTPTPVFEPLPPPSPRPAIVFDSAIAPPSDSHPVGQGQAGENARARAGRLASPSLTVPQGTVIPAVLETALDSTRPGAVRALVQRDIYGFDGSRVLIQRGSRLYGEYEAGLEAGQNRALVRWTRLLRPDGVTIALDSPASDPLGRAGIKGDVDSKFFQRFGGAILQSVLDIGVGIATREASDGVVVALPGSTQNIDVVDRDQVQRTLKVKHGTSVSVFVARDLDFSTVDS